MRCKQTDAGFTLVELVLVVAIIGILVAIGIPLFQSYRAKAFNSNALADLRNMKTGMEAFMSESAVYPSSLLYQ